MARDISKVHYEVRKRAEKLVTECARLGLIIKITDCVRNKAEQNGIDASRTNCKYPNSYHNWGLAFDVCRYEDVDKDGIISDDAYNQKGDFFFKVGQVGKSLGLGWGGDFKSIYDGPHFEYKGLGTRAQIQKKFGTPEKFFASWVLVKPTKTVSQRSSKNDIMWLQKNVSAILEPVNDLSDFIPLDIDGDYGEKTAMGVRALWAVLGWNKDGKDTGWKAGKVTIKKIEELIK